MAENKKPQTVCELIPQFGKLRDEVLFGDVWEQPELSKRDRSMVTVAVLAALGARGAPRLAAQDIHFLDAPVSGGPKGAASGKLAIWVGGDRGVFDAKRADVQSCLTAIDKGQAGPGSLEHVQDPRCLRRSVRRALPGAACPRR